VSDAIHVTVIHVVTKCSECPHKKNTADGWNDPFTSQPAGTDYCGASKADLWLYQPWEIHPSCPLRAAGEVT
jgi:hypothetical protein